MSKLSQCSENADNEINMRLILGLWSIGLIIIGLFVNNPAVLICIILFIVAVCLFYIFFIKHYLSNNYPYKEMRNLVIETLKQVGCQPEIDKKNESHIGFMYQGEHFFISIENECLVTFYNTWWGSLDLNNPDVVNLKEAINLTNAGNIPKVLYTTDNEGQKIGVHSMYRVFLKKEIPALPELFKAILNDFFEVQKEVKGRFNALNDEKVETNKKERVKVKGFINNEH